MEVHYIHFSISLIEEWGGKGCTSIEKKDNRKCMHGNIASKHLKWLCCYFPILNFLFSS